MIPVNTPLVDGNEERYLVECIRSGWVSSEGPFVERFEEQFAARVGRRFGIAVANGSLALDAAVAALDIGHGDEVIMPTFTIISCAAAVVRAGAKPVLVDCDPITWNMDVAAIEARITSRTKAIMAVHIYGLPVRHGPAARNRSQARLARHRGRRRDAWTDLPGKAMRQFRGHQHFQLLPEQAHYDWRGWDDRH